MTLEQLADKIQNEYFWPNQETLEKIIEENHWVDNSDDKYDFYCIESESQRLIYKFGGAHIINKNNQYHATA